MPTMTLSKTLQLYYSKLKRSFKTKLHSHHQPLITRSSVETYSQQLMMTTTSSSTYNFSSSSSFDSDDETATPDFATAFASQRFFFSSPGRSNSIVDESNRFSSSAALKCCHEVDEAADQSDMLVIGGGIPVQTYSPDPYIEFRRSMQEMVEATEILDVCSADNWDYLHELLLCYLALNPKEAHSFIVEAFADLLMSLGSTTPTTSTLTSSSSSSLVDARLHHGGCVG